MSKEIVGELFVRDKQRGKNRVVIICGALQISQSIPLLDEHFYIATGFLYQRKPLLLIHPETTQKAPDYFKGSRFDQIMCDRQWRIPQLKDGQYIGKATAVEIEQDYFSVME